VIEAAGVSCDEPKAGFIFRLVELDGEVDVADLERAARVRAEYADLADAGQILPLGRGYASEQSVDPPCRLRASHALKVQPMLAADRRRRDDSARRAPKRYARDRTLSWRRGRLPKLCMSPFAKPQTRRSIAGRCASRIVAPETVSPSAFSAVNTVFPSPVAQGEPPIGSAAAAPRGRRARTRCRQEDLTMGWGQVILTAMVEPGEVVAQTASEDPEIGLRGVASLRALLEAVEELQIRRARELGWSWQQIAELLGVSKQAVHQKYGKGERPKRRRLR
jgi:hypothetical protein